MISYARIRSCHVEFVKLLLLTFKLVYSPILCVLTDTFIIYCRLLERLETYMEVICYFLVNQTLIIDANRRYDAMNNLDSFRSDGSAIGRGVTT